MRRVVLVVEREVPDDYEGQPLDEMIDAVRVALRADEVEGITLHAAVGADADRVREVFPRGL